MRAPLDPNAKVGERVGEYGQYLGTARPAQVLEQRREVACGEVFGWSLLRAGTRVTSVAADCVQLADGDVTVDVRLAWG